MSLAAFGALLAAVVVFSALKKREAEVQRALAHTAQVVVAARAIPLGAKLQADDVKLARWSRDSLPEGSFSDPQAVVGAFARGRFAANEPIVSERLLVGDKTAGVMPFLIPPGMRAISVAVDEVADISGFVQPHTRVDVLLAISGNGPGESPFSRTVAQNIEVLAVAQEIEKVKDEPEVVKVVTLLVTPGEAERLTLATREGTIRLAMRSYGDSKVVATQGVSIDEMMRGTHPLVPLMEKQPMSPQQVARRARGVTPLQVEILRDGKSSEAYSFINSAVVGHSGGVERDASAPSGIVPPPSLSNDASADSAQAPPQSGTASAVGTASAAVAALVKESSRRSASAAADAGVGANVASGSIEPRPGEVGYQPAPKTFEIGPK